MGKIIAYTAMSLNGKIAQTDGSVGWLDELPNPDKLDYGYYKFYDSIDTTIMGYSTYAQVIGWDIPFPYPDKKNYVVTRQQNMKSSPHVEFITENHIDYFRELKNQNDKDIWLIGGGKTNTMFLNAGLLDKLIVHTMPIILDGGIEIFGGIPKLKQMSLLAHKTYPTGVIESHYTLTDG